MDCTGFLFFFGFTLSFVLMSLSTSKSWYPQIQQTEKGAFLFSFSYNIRYHLIIPFQIMFAKFSYFRSLASRCQKLGVSYVSMSVVKWYYQHWYYVHLFSKKCWQVRCSSLFPDTWSSELSSHWKRSWISMSGDRKVYLNKVWGHTPKLKFFLWQESLPKSQDLVTPELRVRRPGEARHPRPGPHCPRVWSWCGGEGLSSRGCEAPEACLLLSSRGQEDWSGTCLTPRDLVFKRGELE